uniref:Ion_trans_2 domain-containing protein n=1 Tax=Strongyloides papillosus TaxID=174720 RepID=A0A0N5C308_STREA
MDNLQNSKRQSFLGLSQVNKNISVLSEYSSNTQFHFMKSNNSISSKFLDSKINLGKTNDFRNLNTIPFAKTRYSQLYFDNRNLNSRQKGINNATTGFKKNTKEKSSNKKPAYSQNDVDDVLIKFLDSEKDKTNGGNIYRGKLLEESLNNSVLCSQTDIDAVLKAFLNSKKTYDDSLSNESIKNLPFSEKCNSSDMSNVLSNQNISAKEDIPYDSLLGNFITTQTTDPESSVTDISKELLDSKTRMKKHGSDVIHIFDYSENILSKDILENFLSSNRWDLIKHPYVMNFIDNRLIKKHGSYFDFLLIYLNLLIPLYFATILPPLVFTIFGTIEIIFYVLYLFVSFHKYNT